jgi:hypothetical protein
MPDIRGDYLIVASFSSEGLRELYSDLAGCSDDKRFSFHGFQ